MAEAKGEQAFLFGLAGESDEGVQHAGAGAPGDMKAGDGIAVAVGERAAALRPADYREPAHAKRMQPGALFAAAKLR